MAKRDPQIDAHLEWIGFVRPTGLVVSAPALVRAGAVLPRDPEGQRRLRACVAERRLRPDGEPEPWLPEFRAFAESVLGWSFSPKGYAGTAESPIPPELETPLQEGGEVLRPDFAVRERDPRDDGSRWQLLVKVIEPGDDFDRVAGGAGRLEVSAHGRMERLLRQTGVPAGLLSNGRTLRLVSAPRGESSGWLDLHVADMVTTAGRPIVAALRLLLSETRLLALPRDKRFAALLADSRRFQNEVSERLAEQVLHALYELLRGVQAADDAWDRELLRGALTERPDDVYHALLTVILRLVFLLYAEERDLLPEGETFARHYSLAGLYERLREDAALHPDTMNQRYGAWAQLLVLFRLFHDGAEADGLQLPRRLGVLFDPDRFPFLEGRRAGAARQGHECVEPPLVPDGTVYRALDKLLVLDGERISYRALDVEQIGSVYETMMGFRIETATGRSVAIKAQKKQGAPTTVDLEALLGETGGKRAKWLRDRTDRTLTDRVRKPVAAAQSVADLHAALQPVIDTAATPDLVPAGAMVLQPSQARRRSGSHYTPRELTEPIVRTALEPILARLRGPGGEAPTPEAILDLKVCDPAMGSGAFLVEACRQLGDALLDAWRAHDAAPAMAAGDDEVVVARRLIAQRCLYGVDRNPMAVDLAKVSLWLATLAKEHPLTFVDHALRHGDSLVGLTQRQIEAFHWEDGAEPLQQGIETIELRKCVARVAELRRRIRGADETVSDWDRRDWWDEARFEVGKARCSGDLVTTAFFEGSKPKERKARRDEYAGAVFAGEFEGYRGAIEQRRREDPPLVPFHWEIEFPEVFDRAPPTPGERGLARIGQAFEHGRPSADLPVAGSGAADSSSAIEPARPRGPDGSSAVEPAGPGRSPAVAAEAASGPGFDAIVGNPPFAGHVTVVRANLEGYTDWLRFVHSGSSGKCDVVAHFFRRAFDLLRREGAFGFIATNTIAQGDTRSTGLRWICTHGGEVYRARRRVPWPGQAAVVVSVLHVHKGRFAGLRLLDGAEADRITAFLFHRGGHDDPARLAANAGKSFQGSIVLGMGFTFDDTDKKGVASPLAQMRLLIEDDSWNREVIFPYIGGEEVNTSPTHAHHRYVINFKNWPLRRADLGEPWAEADDDRRREWLRRGVVPLDYPDPVAADWPELLAIVEERVEPVRRRASKQSKSSHGLRAGVWWQHYHQAKDLYTAIAGLKRVLATNCGAAPHLAMAWLPAHMVFANTLDIFPFSNDAAFCVLQSRPHEIWARFFASSMKDDLRYTPSDCFETFPFPDGWETHGGLEDAGGRYHDFRATLMARRGEGLTKTYNRLHDRYEDAPDVVTLRTLHAAMDRAVLDAWGWHDIPTDCEFLLDHPIDEEEWGTRKKPWRYRWPDAVRDEVLARLLELNAARAGREAGASRASGIVPVEAAAGAMP